MGSIDRLDARINAWVSSLDRIINTWAYRVGLAHSTRNTNL